MLVLSRQRDETILIGDDIFVTVVSIGEDRVRLGIEAPRGVRILRQELQVHPPTEGPLPTDGHFPGDAA
jgi:carbon storage regulator